MWLFTRVYLRGRVPVLLAGLLVAGVAGVGVPVRADDAVGDPADPTGAALAAARVSGVEQPVDALTTATDRVWALPSGLLGREVYGSPVRVRRDDRWVDVDTTLVGSGSGWLSARVSPSDIAVAAAGSGPLARVGLPGGDAVFDVPGVRSGTAVVAGNEVSWPSGQSAAVEPEGLLLGWPGRVGKGRSGRVVGRFTVSAPAGGSWQELGNGGAELVDSSGRQLLWLAAPELDSTAVDRAGDPRRVIGLRVDVDGGRLVFRSATRVGRGFRGVVRAWVALSASDTWVQKTHHESGQANLSHPALWAGLNNSGDKTRAYLKFNLVALNHTHIVDATLDMTQFDATQWPGHCKDSSGPEIWVRRVTQEVNYSTLMWSNQPASDTRTQRRLPCRGESETGEPPVGKDTARTTGLAPIVQYWVDNETANWGFKVMVDGTDESSHPNRNGTMRKWHSANFMPGEDHVSEPHLYVTYTTGPVWSGYMQATPTGEGDRWMTLSPAFWSGFTEGVGGTSLCFASRPGGGECGGAVGAPGPASWTAAGLAWGTTYTFGGAVLRDSRGSVSTTKGPYERTTNALPSPPAWYSTSPPVSAGLMSVHSPIYTVATSDIDADSGGVGVQQVTTEFQVSGPGCGPCSSGPLTAVGTGQVSWTQYPPLQDAAYSVRARSWNTVIGLQPEQGDGWSAPLSFTVDTTHPGPPNITASAYTPDTWHDPAPPANTFTFTPLGEDPTVVYVVSVNNVSQGEVPSDGAGVGHWSYAPSAPGWYELSVVARDGAGHLSGPGMFGFGIGPGPVVSDLKAAVGSIRGGRSAVTDTTPRLMAKFAANGSGADAVQFEVYDSQSHAVLDSGVVPASDGATVSWQLGTLPATARWAWRARPYNPADAQVGWVVAPTDQWLVANTAPQIGGLDTNPNTHYGLISTTTPVLRAWVASDQTDTYDATARIYRHGTGIEVGDPIKVTTATNRGWVDFPVAEGVLANHASYDWTVQVTDSWGVHSQTATATFDVLDSLAPPAGLTVTGTNTLHPTFSGSVPAGEGWADRVQFQYATLDGDWVTSPMVDPAAWTVDRALQDGVRYRWRMVLHQAAHPATMETVTGHRFTIAYRRVCGLRVGLKCLAVAGAGRP